MSVESTTDCLGERKSGLGECAVCCLDSTRDRCKAHIFNVGAEAGQCTSSTQVHLSAWQSREGVTPPPDPLVKQPLERW